MHISETIATTKQPASKDKFNLNRILGKTPCAVCLGLNRRKLRQLFPTVQQALVAF